MKASKLVSELQEILNHQGDFEVMVDIGEPADEWEYVSPTGEFSIVDIAPDFKYIWIVAR